MIAHREGDSWTRDISSLTLSKGWEVCESLIKGSFGRGKDHGKKQHSLFKFWVWVHLLKAPQILTAWSEATQLLTVWDLIPPTGGPDFPHNVLWSFGDVVKNLFFFLSDWIISYVCTQTLSTILFFLLSRYLCVAQAGLKLSRSSYLSLFCSRIVDMHIPHFHI